MKKLVIVSLMIFGLMNAPQIAAAEEDMWAKTKVTADSAWQSTKSFASDVVDWTVEKSRSAWHVTSEAAEDAAEWSGEKAKQGWQATREIAANTKS